VTEKREYHGAGVGMRRFSMRVEKRINDVSLLSQLGRETGGIVDGPLQLTEAALFRIVIDADH
jgi:hypothetical protein